MVWIPTAALTTREFVGAGVASRLRVALGAERARLEERLLEVDAARVDVETRVHVVQRVDHQVQALPERVWEVGLRLGGHAVLQASTRRQLSETL